MPKLAIECKTQRPFILIKQDLYNAHYSFHHFAYTRNFLSILHVSKNSETLAIEAMKYVVSLATRAYFII